MSTIIGIHHGGHDSSVALVIDGKLVCAIEEEKLTGIKAIHSYWAHPIKGLELIIILAIWVSLSHGPMPSSPITIFPPGFTTLHNSLRHLSFSAKVLIPPK